MVDARRWSHVAEAYRRSFASLCAGTIPTILADLGSPTPGGLLDVGCGAGALARAAAECGWTTTATDVDRDMLDPKQSLDAKKHIGVIPENLALFDNLTARRPIHPAASPLT